MRLLWVLCLLFLSCQDNDAEVRQAVRLLCEEQGEVARRALLRLVPHGPAALMPIEAALHTAPPAGRRNLVLALRRIGSAESAPLLGHLAAYDDDPLVRMEARFTLGLWLAEGGPRGAAARAALRKADEARGTEGAG